MSFWSALPRPIIGLSPMDGVTDASFRAIVARQGKPDDTFTEFTHVHDICRGPEVCLETLVYSEIERPMVAQLYGNNPDLFYQAAHAVCELGFDGLDINMGCPSKSVASSGSGAGLIRTPELARAIVQAAKQAVDQYGVGPAAVRSIAGAMELHVRLEERLAKFKGVEAAITFQSGFNANLGAIQALVGKTDGIFSDELNHASIIDGCRLSGAQIILYSATANGINRNTRRL